MADTFQAEWLNQNSLRNYPFLENVQRRPVFQNGSVVDELAIPNYLITDFVMTVGSDVSNALYLRKLAIVGDSITFVIGSGDTIAASVFVDTTQHTTNKGYVFSGLNEYEDARGCLVVGDVERLRNDIPDGVYNFTESETRFEYRCVRPMIRSVSSMRIYDPLTEHYTKKMYGDIRLVAGDNISLKYDEAHNSIVINADSNEGYNDVCECGQHTQVLSINGISVNDITLIGDDCVSVTKEGHTLKISDKCSKPCCGCAELDFINTKIVQLNTAINKLDNYSVTLGTRLTELQSSYVQSDSGRGSN